MNTQNIILSFFYYHMFRWCQWSSNSIVETFLPLFVSPSNVCISFIYFWGAFCLLDMTFLLVGLFKLSSVALTIWQQWAVHCWVSEAEVHSAWQCDWAPQGAASGHSGPAWLLLVTAPSSVRRFSKSATAQRRDDMRTEVDTQATQNIRIQTARCSSCRFNPFTGSRS